MATKLSNVLFVIIILYLYQIDICSIMANDPFDFRFVSYNGMYMWESPPFTLLFIDRLNQQFNTHTQVYVRSVVLKQEWR
jgi:hypothetical protein